MLTSAALHAQVDNQSSPATTDSLQASGTTPSTPEKKQYDMPRAAVGIRTGINISHMSYSYKPIERYANFSKTRPLFGIFAHFTLGHTPLSFRPELTFTTRCDSLSWLDVAYGITAHYVDLRLPITWNFRFGDGKVSPYILLAPQLNMAYSGSIGYSADDYPSRISTPLAKSNMRSTDLSLMVGAGCDFTVNTDITPIYIALEAGYNFGLINNFAKREIIDESDNPSHIINNFFGAELWHGKRYNRGLEVALRLSLPVDRDFLQRYRDRRKVLPDTIRLVEVKTDTVSGPTDTVYMTQEVQVPVIVREEYHTKECFSIAEINDLINQGENITGKRICMFDIKFDFDSYEIRPESRAPLNELVRLMQDYPQMTIEVYGHTDSIGTAEYNQRLSENRANAVVEYISSHGVSPGRIKSFGYGLNYPIDTNATEEGRFRNRRVEFEVITIGLKRKYKN